MNEIEQLKLYIQKLEQENEELRNENERLRNRKGGRKKKEFTEVDLESIRMYRFQGKTIKELASMFSCSVGLMHKTIKENKL